MNNLPGIETRRNSRYRGSAEDYIEQLRKEGVNVSWYGKTKKPRLGEPDRKCSYFAMRYLDGEMAYTLTDKGEKYMEDRKLKQPEAKPCWYCPGCNTRFHEWPKAKAHRGQGFKQESGK